MLLGYVAHQASLNHPAYYLAPGDHSITWTKPTQTILWDVPEHLKVQVTPAFLQQLAHSFWATVPCMAQRRSHWHRDEENQTAKCRLGLCMVSGGDQGGLSPGQEAKSTFHLQLLAPAGSALSTSEQPGAVTGNHCMLICTSLGIFNSNSFNKGKNWLFFFCLKTELHKSKGFQTLWTWLHVTIFP